MNVRVRGAATRNHSVPRYRIGSLLCLSFCAISVSLRLRMYWPREWPVSFLNIRCRCHLGNRSAQTLFPATGAIPGYPLDPRQNTMDSDGVIITSGHHLTSSYFYGRTFLSVAQAWRLRPPTDFSLTLVPSDPQPDDTARKGLRRPASTANTPRLSAGLGNRSIQPLHQAVEHARHRAQVDDQARFFSSAG